MRSVGWFRAAAILLIVFAAGHTYGFLAFRPQTVEGRAVLAAMESARVMNAGPLTYGSFYRGFGLFVTTFLVFTSWLAWQLGEMASRGLHIARTIAWVLCALECVCAVLGWRYFALPQTLLPALTAVCLCAGAVLCERNDRDLR